MSDITRKVVIEYLQSIISSYETANIRDRHDSNYRMVWLSSKDIEALKIALDSVKKLDKNVVSEEVYTQEYFARKDAELKLYKIEQILKDIPYGGDATVRRIQEVVEDGNVD